MPRTSSGHTFHILLVEDHEPDILLVREAFSEADSEACLTAVKTGEEALELLGRNHGTTLPNLILLDLNLPGKSGHDVLKTIKGNPTWRRIPVVVLTSSQSERDVNMAYDCGANLYVRKPSSLDELYGMIADVDRIFTKRAVLPSQPKHTGHDPAEVR